MVSEQLLHLLHGMNIHGINHVSLGISNVMSNAFYLTWSSIILAFNIAHGMFMVLGCLWSLRLWLSRQLVTLKQIPPKTRPRLGPKQSQIMAISGPNQGQIGAKKVTYYGQNRAKTVTYQGQIGARSAIAWALQLFELLECNELACILLPMTSIIKYLFSDSCYSHSFLPKPTWR